MYSRQQGYAPTPHSYVPDASRYATINLDEEVKLSTNPSMRDQQESLAEIFSILVTLDGIEKAYLKDAIPEADYTETCDRLLKQYKAILADESVASAFTDLETFKATWDMEVPRATERIRIGLPSTVVAAPSTNSAPKLNGESIVDATSDFITFLDALRMNLTAKDELHPLLTDVIQSVNKVTNQDFDSRSKIVQWLITLNQMKAHENLSKEQVRELDSDINMAYQGFKATLSQA